jgi:hypothetical protein
MVARAFGGVIESRNTEDALCRLREKGAWRGECCERDGDN